MNSKHSLSFSNIFPFALINSSKNVSQLIFILLVVLFGVDYPLDIVLPLTGDCLNIVWEEAES